MPWAERMGRLSLLIVRHLAMGLVLAALPAPSALWAQPAKEDRDVREEAEAAQRAMDIFLRAQKVLIRRGEVGLELNSFYSTDTREDFVNLGTTVGRAQVRTRVVESTLIARYGLLNDLEADLRVPFVYADQQIDLGVARLRQDDAGLGDVAAGLRYQVWRERPGTPDVILSVEGKSRTGDEPLLGTGHWNVGGSIALVKTLDPVVFFGRLGYTATLERDGRDPGDEVFYQLGIGYSLNDRVSLSTQLVVGHSKQDDTTIRRSDLDILSLQLGVTVLVTKRMFVEPVVNLGLSEDAPDVIAGINLIYRF
jgi:outer membrane putative beta-barrel porin/alpha-amylase